MCVCNHFGPCSNAGTVKAASAPNSPLKTEGPTPSKPAAPATTSRPENPAKGKGNGKNSGGSERPSVNKKGQPEFCQKWPQTR